MKNARFSKKSPLLEKSFALAIRVVNLHKHLVENKKEYVMSKQLLRAGTNPGAMIREAQNAESGKDFIHKLAIGQKELGETQYWLELLNATDYLKDLEYNSIYEDTEEVMKMLTSSIKTKKRNMSIKIAVCLLTIANFAHFFLY